MAASLASRSGAGAVYSTALAAVAVGQEPSAVCSQPSFRKTLGFPCVRQISNFVESRGLADRGSNTQRRIGQQSSLLLAQTRRSFTARQAASLTCRASSGLEAVADPVSAQGEATPAAQSAPSSPAADIHTAASGAANGAASINGSALNGSALGAAINGATNGSVNGSANGSVNGSTNGSVNGSANGSVNGSANGSVNGSANGSVNSSANGLVNGSANGSANGSLNGSANGNGASAVGVQSLEVPLNDIDEEVSGAADAASLGVVTESAGGEAAVEDGSYYEPAFQLLAASKMIPHPAKVEKGGEDAVLISDVGAGVLAVTDGVGGWAEDGVDPALYSNEFVGHLNDIIENAQDQDDLEPRELLRKAHSMTKSPGAATAVVAVFDGEYSVLNVASLGDAGVRVVRGSEVVHKTTPHEHFFDCPFQFGSESSDSADDAEVLSFSVQEGDTVVMASDGLFDNVFDKDIASIVKVFSGPSHAHVSRTATALAALAAKHAGDKEYMAPYTLEALEHGRDLPVWQKMMGKKLSGGKQDDISVVVARVVTSEVLAQAVLEQGQETETEDEEEVQVGTTTVGQAEGEKTAPEQAESAAAA
ncbi:unnamed protein product [Closterium sp. NIES-64]|nr:unnamed protein product [Closterium sp. NIES-64]CAI6007094.1 unnamed protein product [Closterium sp. NIES-65]